MIDTGREAMVTENRNRIITQLMGTQVTVTVDRPIGYRHGAIVYPINYGYIPGTKAGDAEAQDVYILGVSKPLSTFTGRIIGAIRRRNDREDKLVAAPEGMRFHQGQIAEAVAFQERYFDITVDSVFRKSCGVIPMRKHSGKTEFLVLLQRSGSWSFPKGHMEAGETEARTALRELQEEAGLRAVLLPEKRVTVEYAISTVFRKQVVLLAGEVYGKVVPQTGEIIDYRWVSAQELSRYLHRDTYESCLPLLEQL